MKNQKIISIALISMFLLIPITSIASVNQDSTTVTITIDTIRSLEKEDKQFHFEKIIDANSDPDFYLKIWIGEEEFSSETFWNTKYLYDINFQAVAQISENTNQIPIIIQLWDAADESIAEDRLCDLNKDFGDSQASKEISLVYDMQTGHWTGDDEREDSSGYGRLNGCDDESYYTKELDCELWFDITQTDPDGDGLPTWIETNIYDTDPMIDDTGTDMDNDSIPIEWEWKWGYNPLVWEDHHNLDDDDDSISNWEEYYMRNWSSDPFRKDLFVEMDQMIGPNDESGMFPEGSKEILYTAYNRQNVLYHLDDGKMGEESCADLIPFDELTEISWGEEDELDHIYSEYFLNQSVYDIRKGIFHYGVVIYQSSRVNGNAFGSNRYQISALGMELKAAEPIRQIISSKEIIYASAYMHEMGHSLGFWPIPGHNRFSYYPWQIGFWLSRCYKSCMNYGYMYSAVDYSDGTNGYNDYDDWERMDLSYFEQGW